MTKSICIFGGSAKGVDDSYCKFAEELGRLLARKKITVIYGGGSTGVMGAVANAALNNGGHVIGVIPECMSDNQDILRTVSELFVEKTMHDRKMKMYSLADAFIALPGGIGTIEEVAEVICWMDLELHTKPVLLVNINHYWQAFTAVIENGIAHGFIFPSIIRSILMVDDINRIDALIVNGANRVNRSHFSDQISFNDLA